jgi:hypothetical protein
VAFTASDSARLRALDVRALYLHFFDVDLDEATGEPAPLALAQFSAVPPRFCAVVPVVFVANRVLRGRDPARLRALAVNIAGQVGTMARDAGIAYGEAQIDCDWTDETRAAFFTLLRELRAQPSLRAARLSVTLRLHQVKFRERTGVPPADRCMLMFYNMGRMDTSAGRNSIYDPVAAERYLARLREYPLPLDAALPIFGWVLQLRDGAVVNIFAKTTADEIAALPGMRRQSAAIYRADSSLFFHGGAIRRGDLLKVEHIAPAQARAAALQLFAALPSEPRRVALFEYDSLYLASHDMESLRTLYRACE